MQFTDQYTEYKNANVALFANLSLSFSVPHFFLFQAISSTNQVKASTSLHVVSHRSMFRIENAALHQTGFFYIYEIS